MNEGLQGSLAGLGSGAATGFSIGGPWGAAAGGLLGAAIGASEGSGVGAARRRSQNASQISPVDPVQNWYLNRLQQQERQMRAGTDATSAFASRNAMNVLGQTQANILRASGGNALSGINGLVRAQNATNNAMQGIGAQAAANANNLLMAQGGLIGDMSQRRLRLAEYNRNKLYSEWVNKQQNLNNASAGAIGTMPSLLMSGGFGGQKAAPSPMGIDNTWKTMGTAGGAFSSAPAQPAGYQPPQYQMIPDAQPLQATSSYMDPEYSNPVL